MVSRVRKGEREVRRGEKSGEGSRACRLVSMQNKVIILDKQQAN